MLCLIVISVNPEEAEEREEGKEEAAGGVGFWVEEETAGGESAQTLYRWPETNILLFFFHFVTPLLSSCISPTSDSYSRPTVWFTVVHSAFLCKLTAHEAKLALAKLTVDSRLCCFSDAVIPESEVENKEQENSAAQGNNSRHTAETSTTTNLMLRCTKTNKQAVYHHRRWYLYTNVQHRN